MDSATGTIRQEYFYPVIDTESLLFSLLKQGKCETTNPKETCQDLVVSRFSIGQGSKHVSETCPATCDCHRCRGDCCSSCGKSRPSTANAEVTISSPVTLTVATEKTGSSITSNKVVDTHNAEFVFSCPKSFSKRQTLPFSAKQDHLTNNNKILSRMLTTPNFCSVNIKTTEKNMAQQSPPSVLRHRGSSTMSSTSSLSSDNSGESSSKSRRRIVSRLAKTLREGCDKVLGGSESLIIHWHLLCAALKEIEREENRFGEESTADDRKYQDLVMFLVDIFMYTPTLCISAAADSNKSPSESGGVTGGIDLTRFHSIKFLELKKVPPRVIFNFKIIKRNLTTLRCSKCIECIGEILTEPLLNEAGSGVAAEKKLTCMWPEMTMLDVSNNFIKEIDSVAVEALECCPLLETFIASRNQIRIIAPTFSSLNSITRINFSYNKLQVFPPIPPNCREVILSHNLIASLFNSQNGGRHLESFITQVGPHSQLEVLDLSGNLIAAVESLRVLRDIGSLKHLRLAGNPITYMESYRNVVLSHLNKLAINRHFCLDKKRLTNTEVRYAIEQSKKCKYLPQFSSPRQPQNMSSSLLMNTSQTMTSSSSRPSPLSHVTSLTQSFESNSSSLRSSRRKKPKIREISSIDFPEDYDENLGPGDDGESIVRVPLERPGSALSEDSRSILADHGLEETRATIKALRDKYGADNWLLYQHPGRSEVSKVICISEKPYNTSNNYTAEYNPSRSLPSHPERRVAGRRNSCSQCEGLNNNTSNADSNEKVSSDGISVVASHHNSSEGSVTGRSVDDHCGKVNYSMYDATTSDVGDDLGQTSSSGVTGLDGATTSGLNETSNSSPSETERKPRTRHSIFDMNSDYADEKFPDKSDTCEYFRVFIHGKYNNLICFNGFLFEIDSQDSTIYNKWDLNSLVSLEEEKFDGETETVEFRLTFNTMRKQMREKSFIMSAKHFGKFDRLVSPYIEKTTMEEFIEAFQCTRCQAQFSRAMAFKTVKHDKGKAPKEVLVCPDPLCGNEFLVTLDAIPLPNNECLELERSSLENSVPVPIRSSTPCSAAAEKSMSRSVPKSRSPPIIEAIKHFASSLTSKKVVGNDNTNHCLDNKSDGVSDAKTGTTSSSETVLNTRSDSDIEVLSYESSSIEVLNKCGDSESDEVEVPEAEEVPVPEFQATKSSSKGPMSESTSSGSCAESIVTQYERRLQLQPISQPFSSPSTPLTMSTSSACTSLNSFASNSTLTSASLNSPQKTAASSSTIPVRYDYVDFNKVDHRLQLWSELSVFKSVEENLLALVKCMIITDNSNVLGLVIFSSSKIYLYKITGAEGDKPQEWLTKLNSFDISKFSRLDVLIGRHGVGVDLSGKYFAMIFRDSQRASNFLEFFMCEIGGALEMPPMVRDLSQTQKALMCPTSPLAYFGIVRFAVCDIEYSYPVSAIVLTQEEIILITDLAWMTAKASESVHVKHSKPLTALRQIESLESDPTLIRLICDNTRWELLFETEREKEAFLSALKNDLDVRASTVTVCSPIEP